MKQMLLNRALEMLLPLIIGLLVPPALDALKRAVAWIGKASPQVKQVLAFVMSGLITALAQVVGVGLPTDIAQWDAPVVQTVIGGLLAIALKQHRQVARLKSAEIPPIASPNAPVATFPFDIPPKSDRR